MTSPGLGSGESKLETVVSYILIIGVVISVLLEIIGISLFYKHTVTCRFPKTKQCLLAE